MIRAAGDQVDTGRFDGTVSQHVGQLYNVFAGLVKNRGEQVAQVMGEHPGRLHPHPLAERFHLRPNLLAAHAFSASGDKDLTRGDFLFSGIFQELAAQLGGQEDNPNLALQPYLRPPLPGRFHGDIAHL